MSDGEGTLPVISQTVIIPAHSSICNHSLSWQRNNYSNQGCSGHHYYFLPYFPLSPPPQPPNLNPPATTMASLPMRTTIQKAKQSCTSRHGKQYPSRCNKALELIALMVLPRGPSRPGDRERGESFSFCGPT